MMGTASASGPDRANKAAEAAVACPLLEGHRPVGRARRAGADRGEPQHLQAVESRNAMNTIRRYAADDAHVIYGTAYDESLGDQLRVTVIATGLSPTRRNQQPSISVVHSNVPMQRTGTDNMPVLNHPRRMAPPTHDYSGLTTPSVWRNGRTRRLRRSMRWPATEWTRSRSRRSCASKPIDRRPSCPLPQGPVRPRCERAWPRGFVRRSLKSTRCWPNAP
jgi:hypothetical protein